MDACLDSTTQAKVDELAKRFHQPHAAVVCHIMQWGLSRGPAEMLDGGASKGPVRYLYLYVDAELYTRAEEAAATAGVKIAPWLRWVVRQITLTNVPASWEVERSEKRSHDSPMYSTCFMLRLDEAAQTKLQHLIQQFGVPKAHPIRQLIIQATPEDFPNSWHMEPQSAPCHRWGSRRGIIGR
jgi:hypothetical protein